MIGRYPRTGIVKLLVFEPPLAPGVYPFTLQHGAGLISVFGRQVHNSWMTLRLDTIGCNDY